MVSRIKAIALDGYSEDSFKETMNIVLNSFSKGGFKLEDLYEAEEDEFLGCTLFKLNHNDPLFQWEYRKSDASDDVTLVLGIDVSLPRSGKWIYKDPFEVHIKIRKNDIVFEVLDWNAYAETTGVGLYDKMFHGGN